MIDEHQIQYNPAFESVFLSTERYLMLKGGAGAGKSVVVAQKLVGRFISEKGHRFLVCRKHGVDIKRSVWDLIMNVIGECGHTPFIQINKTERSIKHILTGSEFVFSGIDDPEKIKSIVGVTGVWCEEITEFDEGDIDQLDLRLRGVTAFYKQIIGTFNPVSKRHWIKSKFFDTSSVDVLTHQSTFRDNMFIDDEYKKVLTTRFKSNPRLFQIYVLGMWGEPITGLEFYSQFNVGVHIGDPPSYDPAAPLHVTFDFNVVPHVTVCVWQVKHDRDDDDMITSTTLWCIDEICLEHPLNNTPSAAKRVRSLYNKHTGGVHIYGDPSGASRDTRSESGRNDFTIIFDELRSLNPINRVQPSAPNIINRGQWINSIFDNDDPTVFRIRFAEKCVVTIDDFQLCKTAADGKKSKKRITNKMTGVSFEQYGHATDACEYLFTTLFESAFRDFIHGSVDADKRNIQTQKPTRRKSY
jgi:phage terminase large subunit